MTTTTRAGRRAPTAHRIDDFVDHLRAATDIDPDALATIAAAAEAGTDHPATQALRQRWYDSLSSPDGPDYAGVYGDDHYLADAWDCWANYSRKYVALLANHPEVLPHPVESVADLGCGIGYSTAALAEVFPDAEVVGTNLPGTTQYRVASALGVTMAADLASAPLERPVSLVFASEYFEHFYEPVVHLREVLAAADPLMLVVASTFTQPSIGHFPLYRLAGVDTPGRKVARQFNAVLVEAGYERVDTGFWNNRPQVWTRPHRRPAPTPIPPSTPPTNGASMTTAPSSTRAIEYVPIDDLQPNPANPKAHDTDTIDQSVGRLGYVEPVVIDQRTGYLVSGHGRRTTLLAMQERGEDPPDGIAIDPETGQWLAPAVTGWASRSDTEAQAALVALNRTTELGGWVDTALHEVLSSLADTPAGLQGVGFTAKDLQSLQTIVDGLDATPDLERRYTERINVPEYVPTAEEPPPPYSLCDTTVHDRIAMAVEQALSEGTIDEATARFLLLGAKRHLRFDYAAIAEFYAHQPPEVQRLMEESALVIVDFDDAIAHGFVRFDERLAHLREEDRQRQQDAETPTPDEVDETTVTLVVD